MLRAASVFNQELQRPANISRQLSVEAPDMTMSDNTSSGSQMTNTSRCVLALSLGILMAGSLAKADPPVAPADLPVTRPVVLPRAEMFDLRSKSGIEYRIYVAGQAGAIPETGAPVIYLTDGNLNFPVVLAAAQRQVRGGQSCVVVGIGYATDDPQEVRQRRSLDLTPPTSVEWMQKQAGPLADLKTGGHDQFADFIVNELKPIIERKYSINRQRQTLFGHSFGGLFALHVLFTRPELFQNYIASSPSIWWNDNSVLAEESEFIKKFTGKELPIKLMVSVGELEQGPPGTNARPDPAQPQPPRKTTPAAKELTARLNEAGIPGLKVEYREFADENHGTVVLPAASRGVSFALEPLTR